MNYEPPNKAVAGLVDYCVEHKIDKEILENGGKAPEEFFD